MEMLLLLLLVHAATAAVLSVPATTCTNSYSCGAGMCCRDSTGAVVSDSDNGGFGHVFLQPSMTNGTCSTKKAQKGEVCDSTCQCDTGLACYRPVSGVCCPPQTCYDEAYVKQQQAYWSNCMSNPNCALPP